MTIVFIIDVVIFRSENSIRIKDIVNELYTTRHVKINFERKRTFTIAIMLICYGWAIVKLCIYFDLKTEKLLVDLPTEINKQTKILKTSMQASYFNVIK